MAKDFLIWERDSYIHSTAQRKNAATQEESHVN